MLNKRIFVKKRKEFNIKENKLLIEFKNNLKINSLIDLDYYLIYDIFNTTKEEFETAKNSVFSEINTDEIFEGVDLNDKSFISIETLPNQFDKRAKSAQECLMVLNNKSVATISTGELLVFNNLNVDDLNKIKNYYINPIECREKDLDKLELNNISFDTKEEVVENFIKLNDKELLEMLNNYSLSMSFENFKFCQAYYKKINKNPIIGELKVIDTYWSDHCRHTTFNTILKDIDINDDNILEAYNLYLKLKKEVSKNKEITLMDMATIYGKYAKKNNLLKNLEDTKEDNAISLIIKEDEQELLYQFKNETHNHPTEIEPYGGASTCIGGAIRDPLSGRSYVYQGLRISAGSSILESVENTLEGKLPQKIISSKSADGFSSYGNQIGLATTFVKEFYHPGYKAKHLEAGAVVGVSKRDSVIRKEPELNDIVLLLGGKTGYDGIGGATGSSKKHNKDSINNSAIEVQKGNAPEERKIQRLFTNPKATKLIKKCNDFGAGGVAVAIGELNPSIEIYLDQIPLKVKNLKASDIALSESQERMAVVINKNNKEEFLKYAQEENIECIEVAKITNNNKLTMFFNDKKIIDIDREFLDSNGVKDYQNVKIRFDNNKLNYPSSLKDCFTFENLIDNKSMDTMFDSTVGATTILMPYGGKYQQTKEDVSVQKIPFTKNLTSHVAYGFNPYLCESNQFIGSQNAVIDSVAKLIASGVNLTNINLSFQEYFQKLEQDDKKWGSVVSTLLGALIAQYNLDTPALGGKDSMSGTYENLNVPPTLLSFAFGTSNIDKVISSTIKDENENIYLLKNDDLDYLTIKNNFKIFYELLKENKVSSARTVSDQGIALCITKMLMGNKLSCNIKTTEELFKPSYGSIIFTSKDELPILKLGVTTNNNIIKINNIEENINDLIDLNNNFFKDTYPKMEYTNNVCTIDKKAIKRSYSHKYVKNPKVFIPIFPGTNSEFEMEEAFKKEGCQVKSIVFKNNTNDLIKKSIDEFVLAIKESHIIAIPGGFSGGDEPDGSGKYIVSVLSNPKIKNAIDDHLQNNRLILGICNGFQALLKSGLLTNSTVSKLNVYDPTLFKNDCNYHISSIVNTKVMTTNSPWLKDLDMTKTYKQVISHGEGKLSVNKDIGEKLFENDQVAFCYQDENPNGSFLNIEGLISPCGKILGKMAHSERYSNGLYQNIDGNKKINIFKNAVKYFRGE